MCVDLLWYFLSFGSEMMGLISVFLCVCVGGGMGWGGVEPAYIDVVQ